MKKGGITSSFVGMFDKIGQELDAVSLDSFLRILYVCWTK